MLRVKCLYDFEASHEDDLGFNEGEVLTIVNSDFADGWYLARNSAGMEGMVPVSYVEALPPSMPPPPLPSSRPPQSPSRVYQNEPSPSHRPSYMNSSTTSAAYSNDPQPSYANERVVQPSYSNSTSANTSGTYQNEQRELEYENDVIDGVSNKPRGSGKGPMKPATGGGDTVDDDDFGTIYDEWDEWEEDSDDDMSQTAGSVVINSKSPAAASAGEPPRKRIGSEVSTASDVDGGFDKSSGGVQRTSWFSSGKGMDYLMGNLKVTSLPSEEIHIIQTSEGPYWEHKPLEIIKCELADPTKQTKLKGIKKFLAYQLKSDVKGQTVVSRRYKHFDWLYLRLRERYPIICIPPLPDKQVTGRYDTEFVKKRMYRLQHWVNRMSRHPVIGRSAVYRHFITAEEQKWKDGKRKAEKDEFKESAFFLTVKKPAANIELVDMAVKIEKFSAFAVGLRENLKTLNTRSQTKVKLHRTLYKQQFNKFGAAFRDISETLSVDGRPNNIALAKALEYTGDTYEEISRLYDDQPQRDFIPLIEGLWEYNGIINHIPELKNLHVNSVNKVRSLQDQEELGRVDSEQVAQVQDRAKVVTYAILAEMNNFQADRVVDFKDMMKDFLQQQIEFYQKITERLQLAAERYDKINP